MVGCDIFHLPSPSFSNSFAKRLLKIYKHWKREREGKKEDDSFVWWEKDYELIPQSQNGLLFEYLELGEAALFSGLVENSKQVYSV